MAVTSPLETAVEYGQAGTVQHLLLHGANPNLMIGECCTSKGGTRYNHRDSVTLAPLPLGVASVLNCNPGSTPLIHAMRIFYLSHDTKAIRPAIIDCVRYLMRAGADPNLWHHVIALLALNVLSSQVALHRRAAETPAKELCVDRLHVLTSSSEAACGRRPRCSVRHLRVGSTLLTSPPRSSA